MDCPTLIAPKTTPGSLADLINYAPVQAEAPEIIKNAQDELFSCLRVREMRKSLSLQLAAGVSLAPLPSDFLDAEVLLDTFGNKVKRIDDASLLAARAFDSTGALIASYPGSYGIFDNSFQFDCAMLSTITINGMYYGATYIVPDQGVSGQSGFVAGTPTNVLTTRYSHLFRAMLLKHAYAWYKDWEAASGYQKQAEDYIAQIEANDDLSYRGLDDRDMGWRP